MLKTRAFGADRLEFELHFVPLGDDVVHHDIDEGRWPLFGRHAAQHAGSQRFCDLLQDLLLGYAITFGAGLLQVLFKRTSGNKLISQSTCTSKRPAIRQDGEYVFCEPISD